MEGEEVTERVWIRKYFVEVAAIAAALAFLHALWRVTRSGHKLRLPPSPPGYPLIGHFLAVGKTPHKNFHRLSQRYGPLIYLRLGALPTLVASSIEMSKEILKTSDHIFASRHPTVQGEIIFYNHQDLLCSPLGENTRFLRKLCAVELFSNRRMQQFRADRKEEVLAGIEQILNEGQGSDRVDVARRVMEVTYNNVTRILFGKRFYGNKTVQTESQTFLKLIDDYFSVLLIGVPDFFPFLRRFDLDGYEKTLRKLHIQLDAFLNTILKEHRERGLGQKTEASDFVDVLLQLQANNSNDGQALTDEGIKGLLWDLLLGGTDTSATQVEWTLAALMKYPGVLNKVQEELDSVVGRERLVEEADLDRLPYLRAVVKETMRLHPVAPITIPRKPIKATTIAGYDIPEDTMVMVSVYSIMRDPNLWPDPLKFDPERFIDSTIDHKGLHFEFTPFGSGRRMCPGMNLGLLMVEIIVALIVQACEISLPQGMKPEDVDMEEETRSVVAIKRPIKYVVSPRLPANVYSEAGIEL